MSITEYALIESKSLRESVISRVEVLEKVKKLTMLPDDIHTSVGMVSEFYEVDQEALKKVIQNNRVELESDGLRILKGQSSELRELKSLGVVPKNAAWFTIITRRAVLRIGMLLRDSEVAKEVRSYLLNREQTEKSIVPIASVSPTSIEDLIIMQATSVKELKAEVADIKAKLERDSETIDSVKDTVDKMASNMLAIPDSEVVKKTVNELIRWTRLNHENIYNSIYATLKMKYGIDVPRRVNNEREKIQEKRIKEKGRRYSDSTMRTLVTGIGVMVRMGCLDKFHEIANAWLAKEKSKSSLRLVSRIERDNNQIS